MTSKTCPVCAKKMPVPNPTENRVCSAECAAEAERENANSHKKCES